MSFAKLLSQEKAVEATKQKDEKRKNLSLRNTKACHCVNIALLQSVAGIGTHSTIKSSRKTLHEFMSYIPQKAPKMNISSSTNEMLHTDIHATPFLSRFAVFA
jgi:hypothetical protein